MARSDFSITHSAKLNVKAVSGKIQVLQLLRQSHNAALRK